MGTRRIDLDRARREAKALLRAARAGNTEALGRFRGDREPRLADAQLAVARDLGERSWPALVRHVQARGAALRSAARDGDSQEVYRLLEDGAPPNARDPQTGEAALHVAAARGRLDVVDSLVGWVPVDKHARDGAGRTALQACVDGSGDLVVAKVLVSAGLRPEPAMLDGATGELAEWLREAMQRAEPAPLPELFGEQAWAAQVAMLESLAQSSLAATRKVGDGFAVATGQPDNTYNGVVCSRLPAARADQEIESVLNWLAVRDAPAQWLVRAETDPADLGERLQRARCRPERTGVHMGGRLVELELSPAAAPSGLDVVRIGDEASLAAALHNLRQAKLLASLGLREDAPVRHYSAFLSGAVVGVASVLIDGTTVDVLELEVSPPARRRGIGRALLLHALREGLVAGCSVVVLAPTPASVPFYEELGLTLGRFPRDRAFYTPLG